MRKSTKAFLCLSSYIISYILCFGLSALICFLIWNDIRVVGHMNLMFVLTAVIALPVCTFAVFPCMNAMLLRYLRKSKASLSLAKNIRKYGKQLPSGGSAVFFIKDDEALTVVNASAGFWRLIGGRRSNQSFSLASVIHEDDLEYVRSVILGSELTIPQLDFRVDLPESGLSWWRLCGVKEELSHSGVTITNCVAIDITDFMNTERELNLEKERYQLLLSHLSNAIWEYDVKSDQLSMLNRNKVDGKFHLIEDYRSSFISSGEIHPDHINEFLRICDQLRSKADNISGELRIRNNSGNYAWYSVTGAPLRDAHGSIISYIGQIKLIKNNRDIEHSSISDYDALTRLNNRYAFEGLVNALLNNAGKRMHGALFVLNVDNFQRINNSLGRLFGDALLIELSEALKNLFPTNSVLSRISADEFAVYIDDYSSEEKLFELAGAVCSCIKHCYISTDKSESVTCCVGVSLCPIHGSTFEQLFYLADSALIVAKHRGPGTYYVYNNGIEDQLSDLLREHDEHLEAAVSDVTSLSLQDNTLLSQAVDILFESRELSSSINLIISLLGHRFRLDRAYVIEFSGDRKHGTVTYNWSPEINSSAEHEHTIMPIDVARSNILCTSKDEFFLCNNMASLMSDQTPASGINSTYGVCAMLQCPILDGSELHGCFTYAFCRDDACFHEDDVRQIIMITKIIIGYLVRLRTKQDVDRITYRDKLTGAMNFNAFHLELEHALRSSSDRNYAIVYSDIDRFKFVNEKYGYRAGDGILCAIADIFRSELEPDELFARISADKFIALLGFGSTLELEKRINSLHEMINNIQKTEAGNYHLPVRSGVYVIQKSDTSISAMIDCANLARKSVKNIHINTIAYFNEKLKSRLSRQKDIEEVMADALEHEEFVIHYQPKFSLSTNKLAGAEALVRWKRPNSSKLMRPDEFIPIFEDNGFVVELDFYVLERVCRKLRNDINKGISVIPISVNFSRTHLNSDDLVHRLSSCLKKYNIPPHLIEIEITESALTENEGYLIDIIGELHGIGLIVSMDDFGSGFSSLNLLKKLPVDVLKIDKNFFAGDSATERERCIIENVVNMARALGIHVVSEGVETAEQATFLRSINCDLAQGYLFGPPLDEASFDRTYLLT